MNKYIVMIRSTCGYTIERVIIEAKSKEEVKEEILKEYCDFFPNRKVYQKRKDKEFVYCLIYELNEYWNEYWCKKSACPICGKETSALERANMGIRSQYCSSTCEIKAKELSIIQDISSNQIYIYRITQKSSGKCYIGKTKKLFIWRWEEHLKGDTGTKFHEELKKIKINDLTFEVLEVLPKGMDDKDVFKIESEYIKQFDSINNGFNTLISNKDVYSYNDYFDEVVNMRVHDEQ